MTDSVPNHHLRAQFEILTPFNSDDPREHSLCRPTQPPRSTFCRPSPPTPRAPWAPRPCEGNGNLRTPPRVYTSVHELKSASSGPASPPTTGFSRLFLEGRVHKPTTPRGFAHGAHSPSRLLAPLTPLRSAPDRSSSNRVPDVPAHVPVDQDHRYCRHYCRRKEQHVGRHLSADTDKKRNTSWNRVLGLRDQ
jgi:hypothetical protein